MLSSPEVSPEVRAAVRSLVPGSVLNRSIRPRSRDPGLIYWRQTVVPETTARQLLGFAPPVLPSLREEALVEHLSFHSGSMAPGAAGAVSIPPSEVRFRVSYLPVGLPWVRAVTFSVLSGATLVTWTGEDDTSARADGPSWPERIASGADRDREGDQPGRDFTVVEVGGARVGVQVGGSDLVLLTWRVRCAGAWFRASLMTQRDPVDALELALGDGLLSVR